MANIWHYAKGPKWLTSYHAYGEALAIAQPGSKQEAECLLQRAALLMELANSGKGTMVECRRACLLIRERVSPQFQRVRAVADLIHAEALFNEEKYEESLQEMVNLQTRWPGRWREVAAAQVYAGIACCKLEKLDRAEELLQGVLKMDVKGADFFQWRGTPRSANRDAAQWLAHIAWQKGDAEKAKSYEALVNQITDEILQASAAKETK
jgi:hypothetical protein